MSSKEEEILGVLREELLGLEDIRACMVARKNLEGIVPITEEFKIEVTETWDVLRDVLNEFFSIIERYSRNGLDKAYFEMGRYGVFFYVLESSDTALVAISGKEAEKSSIEHMLEKARGRIVGIINGVECRTGDNAERMADCGLSDDNLK